MPRFIYHLQTFNVDDMNESVKVLFVGSFSLSFSLFLACFDFIFSHKMCVSCSRAAFLG